MNKGIPTLGLKAFTTTNQASASVAKKPVSPPGQGPNPMAKKPIPTAKPEDPPPFEQQQAPNQNSINEDPEHQDTGNPNAPSQNVVDAAQIGNNTTNPEGDFDPQKDSIQDEPGQELHEKTSIGADDVHQLLGASNELEQMVGPDAHEPFMAAVSHLGDASRQATFGQHEGAAMSMGHAVAALQRAQDAEKDPKVAAAIQAHMEASTAAGNKLLDQNDNRPPWNPLPAKSWRGIRVIEVT